MDAINPPITRFAKDAEGNFWAVCGDRAYPFPVTPGAWDQLVTMLAPKYTNPTPVLPGWTSLTLTPADDINAALAVAGPNYELTLAPGEYRETLKISVPVT